MKTILCVLYVSAFIPLTGCKFNSSGWPVIPFMNNGNSQRAEITPQQRDALMAEYSQRQDARFGRFSDSPLLSPEMMRESFMVQVPTSDDDYCANCVGAQPENATYTFKVVERSPGAHGGPYSYGLKRTYDGTNYIRMCKFVNDTFAYNFDVTVTLTCFGEPNKFWRVETWASNQP